PPGVLPEEALAAARKHQDRIVGRLIALIDSAARAAEQGHEVEHEGHFFALFLLTEFRATQALPAIVAAICLPGEIPFDLFGDAVTETLPRTLAVLASDRISDVILPLIGNREINDYVRRAAANSLAEMTAAGQRERSEMVDTLRELLREAIAKKDHELIDG